MMSSSVFSIFVRCTVLGVCVWPAAIAAQQPVAGPLVATVSTSGSAFAMLEGRLGQAESTGLQRLVDVSFSNTPLVDAVNEIADQAGIRLVFRRSVLGERRVTLARTKASAADAFAAVLRETGLVVNATSSANGVYTLSPARASRADGVIVGKVVHAKTKQPIVGATVTLDDATQGVVTNEQGEFRLPATAGERTIRVRGIGFVRYAQRVNVGDGVTVTVEVALEPSANVLNEVIVTGTVVETERRAITTPITVITSEDIEKRGITRIEELMRGEIPGLIAIDRGIANYSDVEGIMTSSRMYSRGSAMLSGEANPIKTYIDGVELLDPNILGTIDPNTIERIEIVTGPQAATIYGTGAMGGVMQIFTKRGSVAAIGEVTMRIGYGMLQSNLSQGIAPIHKHALNANGGIGAALSYSLNVSYNYSGQWQPGLYSRGWGGGAGVSHTNGPLTVKASLSLSGRENGSYQVSGGNNYCAFGEDACFKTLFNETLAAAGDLPPQQSFLMNKRISRAGSQMMGLTLDYAARPWWHHSLTVGRSQSASALDPEMPRYFTPTDTLYNSQESNGVRTTVNYNSTVQASLGHMAATLTLGGNGSFGDRTSITGLLPGRSSSAYIPERLRVGKPITGRSVGGFASTRIALYDHLYVTVGVRGEQNPTYGRNHKIDWTPTNGIAFVRDFEDVTVKLLGSYGSATRAPLDEWRQAAWETDLRFEPSVYQWRYENPMLTPEYSRGPQGGIEMYFGNHGSFTLTHYQQKVISLIESVTVDTVLLHIIADNSTYARTVSQYLNTSTIRQIGWEGTGSGFVGPFSIKMTYSWNDSRIIQSPRKNAPLMSSGIGGTFYYVPTHTGNMVLGYSARGTSVTLSSNWIGSMIQNSGRDLAGLIRRQSRVPQYVDRRRTAVAKISVPGYLKTNLAATYRISQKITGQLNITNLGNSYTSDLGQLFPTLGRQTLLGVSIRLK